jgi:hypothetical protein
MAKDGEHRQYRSGLPQKHDPVCAADGWPPCHATLCALQGLPEESRMMMKRTALTRSDAYSATVCQRVEDGVVNAAVQPRLVAALSIEALRK